jgi:hypothetical protein
MKTHMQSMWVFSCLNFLKPRLKENLGMKKTRFAKAWSLHSEFGAKQDLLSWRGHKAKNPHVLYVGFFLLKSYQVGCEN